MKIFNQVIAIVLIGSMSVAQSGCSMVVPSKQRFSVTTSEPDAKIYVNGEYMGQGNIQTRVKRNDDVSLLVKKDGYIPVSKSIGNDFSITGILDIVGGFIFFCIPWIGLFFPGARKLEQSNVAVVLEKENTTNQGNTQLQR